MNKSETGPEPENRSAPKTRSVPQALWPERHAIIVADVPAKAVSDEAELNQDRNAEQDASWIVVRDLEAGS